MAGITPRELGVVGLSCLASLEGQGGQVVGLLPHHVSGALQSWLQQMDGRVRARYRLLVQTAAQACNQLPIFSGCGRPCLHASS
jgi:hypothetical protein